MKLPVLEYPCDIIRLFVLLSCKSVDVYVKLALVLAPTQQGSPGISEFIGPTPSPGFSKFTG